MSKRTYTHIQELLPTIQAMVTEGMTQREIAEYFGFKDKTVVKLALLRARKKGTTLPKFRERKPAKTLQEYKYENKRLKMENELLQYLKENTADDVQELLKTESNAEALAQCAPFTRDYPVPETGAMYYLCENGACKAPVTSLTELGL